MNQHRLSAQTLSVAYGDRTVLGPVDIDLPPGEVTCIVGANASGKSTLLRSLARLLKPSAGQVLLDGTDIAARPTREVARTVGMLPQSPTAPDGVLVADLVARGRHPHQGLLGRWRPEDERALRRALEVTGTLELAERPVDELSGGQRQRVWIALALAQETDVLLLDEPTTFLDVTHQVQVLDLVEDLNAERGTTVAMVLHDLNLAARYADHLIAVADGRVAASGRPAEVVTEQMVHEVFGLECRVVDDPVTGTPLVVPLDRRARAARRSENEHPGSAAGQNVGV
ncbi:ABC transporter ATP-binding protein [Nocardioidaceae bacterium]|nr:ABC transporter ATP-binding protein [Nocardioidaceae bacterium]